MQSRYWLGLFLIKRPKKVLAFELPLTLSSFQGHVPASHHPQRVVIPGKQVSVRLNKSQIDKASKDKSGKFSENFNVTLFLLRPNDQTLKEDYSRGQMAESWPSGDRATQSSDDSSDDDIDDHCHR